MSPEKPTPDAKHDGRGKQEGHQISRTLKTPDAKQDGRGEGKGPPKQPHTPQKPTGQAQSKLDASRRAKRRRRFLSMETNERNRGP